MRTESVVRARIDAGTKARASKALAEMGLSISDAIRLLLLRIADEKRLPFEVKVPNKATAKAIEDIEKGKAKRFDSKEDLFDDLGI